MLKLSS